MSPVTPSGYRQYTLGRVIVTDQLFPSDLSVPCQWTWTAKRLRGGISMKMCARLSGLPEGLLLTDSAQNAPDVSGLE